MLMEQTSPALRSGGRIQRRTNDMPVLHLEPEIPSSDAWQLQVDGLVAQPASWSLGDIQSMVAEKRTWDLNCVWGWTRPGCRWEGVPAGRLIEAASPLPEARFVMATAMGGHYNSCLTLNKARRCLLAWRLDGAPLKPEHGWPLRLVTPPTKWGYKGVKWITRLTLMAEFEPGFWEGLVGDPHGEVPAEILGHLDERLRESAEIDLRKDMK
jgi:DMSO/TMAO reductase YedYZ molybdopterin-dependent catalytic subunit